MIRRSKKQTEEDKLVRHTGIRTRSHTNRNGQLTRKTDRLKKDADRYERIYCG